MQVKIFHTSWRPTTDILSLVRMTQRCLHSGSSHAEEQCRSGSGTDRTRTPRIWNENGRHHQADNWFSSSKWAATGWTWPGCCLTDFRLIQRRSGWSGISSSKIPADYQIRCAQYTVIFEIHLNYICLYIIISYAFHWLIDEWMDRSVGRSVIDRSIDRSSIDRRSIHSFIHYSLSHSFTQSVTHSLTHFSKYSKYFFCILLIRDAYA